MKNETVKQRQRKLTLILLTLFVSLSAAQVQIEPRVFEIADKLRCPVCVSESVAESSSATSVEMRALIQEKLNEGQSETEILNYFQTRYGDWILLTPPRRGYYLVVWLAPVVGGLLILGTVLFYLWRWTKRSAVPVEADPAYLVSVQQLTASEKGSK